MSTDYRIKCRRCRWVGAYEERHRTRGRFTRNAVTIRGIDVVWFSLVKEQDA